MEARHARESPSRSSDGWDSTAHDSTHSEDVAEEGTSDDASEGDSQRTWRVNPPAFVGIDPEVVALVLKACERGKAWEESVACLTSQQDVDVELAGLVTGSWWKRWKRWCINTCTIVFILFIVVVLILIVILWRCYSSPWKLGQLPWEFCRGFL
mmetsp:Transcript_30941/g.60552  ORF Transcript_30941/g.60552 Transcript_30941/m.60552 type:complete len:154 (-) Transcript_30941:738-1199(-)